jgi:GPH family glycoside/pentoside/hexuronide:cation symporter
MKQVPLSVKLSYASGEIAIGFSQTVVAILFLFYLTDVARLPAILAGLVIYIGVFWDAVSDPIMGMISDHTRTRLGRRRVYFLVASIPYGLSFFLCFALPPTENTTLLFVLATAAYLFHTTATTVYLVPYRTLTAELTDDYDTRTNIVGWLMAFNIAAALVAAAFALPLIRAFGGGHAGYRTMGLIFGVVMTVSGLASFVGTREDPRFIPYEKRLTLARSLKTALGNRPFMAIAWVFVFAWVGVAFVQTSLMYYMKYCLFIEQYADYIFFLLYLASFAFIPLWVKVSDRYGKKPAFYAGMAVMIPCLIVMSVLPESMAWLSFALSFAAGIGASSVSVITISIIPDVIEYDELSVGIRREGFLYSLIFFAYKVAVACAIFFTGLFLDLSGYVENVFPQKGSALLAIRLLVGVVPTVMVLVAVWFMTTYPITKEKHEQIKEKLRGKGAAS